MYLSDILRHCELVKARWPEWCFEESSSKRVGVSVMDCGYEVEKLGISCGGRGVMAWYSGDSPMRWSRLLVRNAAKDVPRPQAAAALKSRKAQPARSLAIVETPSIMSSLCSSVDLFNFTRIPP